ncbi:SMC-Scp complex subunit ScpB [Kribbella sp. NPDC051718]|uniref:SMC-Scp complex subunit ScpB n=1 Tax=Kribbella sp. NPDC051718 TaxID=3155168 RepID=UPI00343A6E18
MRRALEAILMVSDEPLPVLAMAKTVGRKVADVSAALTGLSEEYTEQGRGFDLREVGGGWRYYTREDTAQYVEGYVLEGQQARLTQAALETLAVVAYKQPVSRARVSAIRGVNVDGVMRTLISRGLLEEAGPDTESQSTLYRTTSYFLERMGMQSLDDLPELAPYLPEMDDMEEELAAQSATPTDPTSEDTPEDDNTPLENDLAPPTLPIAPDDELAGDDSEVGDEGDADAELVGDDAEVGDEDDAEAELVDEAEEADGVRAIEGVTDDPADEVDAGEIASGEEAVEVTDAADEAELADGAGGGQDDEGEGAGVGGVGGGVETVGGPGSGGSGESKSGLND